MVRSVKPSVSCKRLEGFLSLCICLVAEEEVAMGLDMKNAPKIYPQGIFLYKGVAC